MILTCPSCGTQYVVKDGAIPPEGRQVRCAACKHSWHQQPESDDHSEPAPQPAMNAEEPPIADSESASHEATTAAEEPATRDDDSDESLAEATLIEPRSGPEAEERAYEESVIEQSEASSADASARDQAPAPEASMRAARGDGQTAESDWDAPPEAEPAPDMFSPFAGEDEETPRRRSGLSKLLIAVLVIVALAVAFWFLAPANLMAKLGLASGAASPLQVSNPPHVERIQLASGNQLLTVSGRVINPTASEQIVPALNARLTDQAGKLVYSWTIDPPARSLAAGASASFNSAEVNVPPGGEYLTITLGQKA